MKIFAIAVASAALALGGCNLLPGSQTAANDNAANASGNAATNQAGGSKDPVQVADAGLINSRSLQAMSGSSGGKDPAAGGAAVPAAMLIGRWTDDGDCSHDTLIRPDGTFRAVNGGEGQWQLEGDELTMAGDQASVTVRIQFADPNTLNVYHPNGSTGRSTRC